MLYCIVMSWYKKLKKQLLVLRVAYVTYVLEGPVRY